MTMEPESAMKIEATGPVLVFGGPYSNLEATEAVRLIQRDTRRYAKRQMTWFRADPQIRWFQAAPLDHSAIEKAVADFYENASPNATKPK